MKTRSSNMANYKGGKQQRRIEKERTRGYLNNPNNTSLTTFSASLTLQNLMAATEEEGHHENGSKTPMNEWVTESDMEAAQQLIQLSNNGDDDNNNNTNDNNVVTAGKRNKRRCEAEDMALEKRIQESEVSRPKKKSKKYRSLVDIYKVTKPINNNDAGMEQQQWY